MFPGPRGICFLQSSSCLDLSISYSFGWNICVLVTQSCPTLYNPMDYSLSGSSVHGILQARTLEWVAILFSRGPSQPRGRTWVLCIAGRLFTIWDTRNTGHLCFHKLPPLAHSRFFMLVCVSWLSTQIIWMKLPGMSYLLNSSWMCACYAPVTVLGTHNTLYEPNR